MATYKAAQMSYVDGKVIEPGQQFTVGNYLDPKTKKMRPHTPGPHWEAVDDEARAICKELKHEYTGEVPDIVNQLSDKLDGMMREKAAASFDHEALAAAIAKGIAAGMVAVAQAQMDAQEARYREQDAAREAATAKVDTGKADPAKTV